MYIIKIIYYLCARFIFITRTQKINQELSYADKIN